MRRGAAGVLALCLAATLPGCDAPDPVAVAEAHEKGRLARAAGDREAARSAFWRAQTLDPEHVASAVALGEMAEEEGRSGVALSHYDRALSANNPGASPYLHLARLQLERGAWSEALAHVIAAYRFEPGEPAVLARKASVLTLLGLADGAERAAMRALTVDPTAPVAVEAVVRLTLAKAGPEAALQRLSTMPERAAEPLVSLRLALLDRLGRPDDAIDCLRTALAAQAMARRSDGVAPHAGDVEGRLVQRLVDRLVARGRVGEAARTLDRRLEVMPVESETLRRRLEIALAREGLTGAESRLAAHLTLARQGGRISADEAAVLEARLRSSLMLAVGDTAEASALARPDAVRTSLARAPLAEIARRAAAWQGVDRAETALGEVAAALRERPHEAALAGLFAAIALEGGLAADGVATLDAMMRRDGLHVASPALLMALARLALASGRETAAVEALDAAIRLGGGPEEALIARARLAAAHGRAAEARRHLGEVVAARPGATLVMTALGRTLVEDGQRHQARAMLARMMEAAVRRGEPATDAAPLAIALALSEDAPPETALAAMLEQPGLGEDPAMAHAAARALLADGVAPGARPPQGPRRRAAMAVAEAAMRQAPGSEAGYLLAARLSDTDAAAIEVLTAGLEAVGMPRAIRLERALRAERAGRPDLAIADYEVLMAMVPGSLLVANNLASLLADRAAAPGEIDRAARLAERLDGHEVPEFMDTLGWLRVRSGAVEDGLPLLRRAAEALPQSAAVHYHLSSAYIAAGHAAAAAEALTRARQLEETGAMAVGGTQPAPNERLSAPDNPLVHR